MAVTIIKSDAEFRKLIPNVLATTEGETSFFDKLSPFLETASEWIEENFAEANIIYNQVNVSGEPQELVKRLAAYHAFLLAIPSLDLVLTPNGFGIINNSNVAPASKERIERLMAIVEKQRNDTIELYLKYTNMYNSQWTSTRQGRYFTATLFPNITLCDRCGITEHRWERYKQFREQLVLIETKHANEFFSPEQMATIRRQIPYWVFDKPNTLQTQVIEAIRNLEVSLLTGLQPHPQQFRDIVNIMRNSPNYFSDWANSDTAKLFAPELFINKKSSAGYWF